MHERGNDSCGECVHEAPLTISKLHGSIYGHLSMHAKGIVELADFHPSRNGIVLGTHRGRPRREGLVEILETIIYIYVLSSVRSSSLELLVFVVVELSSTVQMIRMYRSVLISTQVLMPNALNSSCLRT